jgi:hypothetical protein
MIWIAIEEKEAAELRRKAELCEHAAAFCKAYRASYDMWVMWKYNAKLLRKEADTLANNGKRNIR